MIDRDSCGYKPFGEGGAYNLTSAPVPAWFDIPGPEPEPMPKRKVSEHVERSFKFTNYALETVRTMEERLDCGNITTLAAICTRADPGQGPGGKHTYRRIAVSCHRTVCAVCGDDVLKTRARELTQKEQHIKTEYYKKGIDLSYKEPARHGYRAKRCYYVELIISPPKDQYKNYQTLDGHNKMYRTASEYARQIGCIGGISFEHAVRGSTKEIESWMKGELELDFSPHFHFIGFMPHRHLIKSNEFEAKTGWIYKVVPKWSWGPTKRTLYQKIHYELDHACVTAHEVIAVKDYNGTPVESVRWQHGQVDRHHGIAHYSKIEKIERYEPEKCKCKDCEGSVYVNNLDMVTRADEPNQVLIERLFILRPGALDKCIERYNLVVGSPHGEKLECYS